MGPKISCNFLNVLNIVYFVTVDHGQYGLWHDCLLYYPIRDNDVQSYVATHQLIYYCLRPVKMASLDFQPIMRKLATFTFKELYYKLNASSAQLLSWSTFIDLVKNYILNDGKKNFQILKKRFMPLTSLGVRNLLSAGKAIFFLTDFQHRLVTGCVAGSSLMRCKSSSVNISKGALLLFNTFVYKYFLLPSCIRVLLQMYNACDLPSIFNCKYVTNVHCFWLFLFLCGDFDVRERGDYRYWDPNHAICIKMWISFFLLSAPINHYNRRTHINA